MEENYKFNIKASLKYTSEASFQ